MEVLVSLDKSKDPKKRVILLADTEYSRYFKTREQEIAFYFKVNNMIFDKCLGIKKIHMTDMRKAKELKNAYLRMFHPDRKGQNETGLNYDEISADIDATFHRVSGGKI
ncbi:hypothetical protein CCX46_09060 [Pseudomonas sp. RU47]|uniref:hypothetical protein n=1 Tax=Pseudomonas sp. RU47 TaxID=2005388 RepID=UPI000FDEFE85|nr:hypothetical protein [Pseudomonas sp. RU47]AZZ75292.1 hypothetical protein CCX46_09060 [Pseudomonas sp. RU47]